MRNLPPQMIHVLRHFELLFSERMWEWVSMLVVGAILAPSKRTVTACLRVMGLSQERQFQAYHRVLNRAKWSSRKLRRVLLRLLLQAVVSTDAPVILGSDEQLERRHGPKIAAKGIYLSRFGSFEHVVLRHIAWGALGVCHAAGTDSVGETHMGLAVSDRPGSCRTLPSGAQAPPQTSLDVGKTDSWASTTLVAQPHACAYCRQHIGGT